VEDLPGLTESEATRRRAAGEGNLAQPSAGRTYAGIVLENAFSPVNTFLFATCLVLVWLGLPIDAAVTSIPVALNVLASVVLEGRAKRQLDRLAIITRPTATVRRDAREHQVPPTELVRGDLVVVSRGDQIVLDGEIVAGRLELDESLLTGESEPIGRGPGEAVLSGGACLGGRAIYRVTRVGRASYANQLVERAREARSERTPLQRDVGRLVGASAVLVLLASVGVAIDYWGAGRLASREAVQAAAVLVAIVPQGLVIISTLTYAVGAVSISRAGALVQRVNAVESMSRADTLVLDKTGTLTSPRLELTRCEALDGDDHARAALTSVAAEPAFTDRTTAAIRAWLESSGSAAPNGRAPAERVVPFASDRRWSGIGWGDSDAVILGAPDVLAARLDGVPGLVDRAEAWADEGLRVLLLARGSAGEGLRDGPDPALPDRLTAVALLAFAEELRPDAKSTLASLADAGLRMKVASGDHRRTVAAIAARVGLDASAAVDGAQLAALDDAALARESEARSIFGRVEPALKARLIRALRRSGHYVAMVGDGVNDIIALKEANIGLVMQNGSPAARAASDVVLLGDSFAVIPRAVVAGQRIVEGMRLVTCLLFSRTVSALVIVLGAPLLALEFPFTPRTNSILALLTVGIPTLALAAWAPSGRSRAPLVPSALRFSVPAGVALAAVALPVYWVYATGTGDTGIARSALATVGIFCGILLIPFLSPPGAPPARDLRPTALAGVMVVAFAVVQLVPGLRAVFELEALSAVDVLSLAAVALAWAWVLFRLRAVRFVPRVILSARRVLRKGDA
jgi:cation-transporting ATPase E